MLPDWAWSFVKRWEGGLVDDPADPGGVTKWGVSKRSYPSLDIAALTEDDAKAIYHRDYWLKAGCDQLAKPWALAVFDTAVNLGVSRTKGFYKAHQASLEDFLVRRIQHYASLATFPRFGRGWLRRVLNLYKTCLTLAK